MTNCMLCNGSGNVLLGGNYSECSACEGTGIALGKKIPVNVSLTVNMTKIDGLTIKCGEKSLWVSREAVEDMLSGKSDGAGRLTSPIGITITPNVVKIPILNAVEKE